MPHILLHRPTPWESEIVCSTKRLARLFARNGVDVTYLHAPLDPVHLLRGSSGYLSTWRNTPHREGRVRVVTPASPIPARDINPLNSALAMDLRYRLTIPSLRKLVMADGMPAPDVVWTTVPGTVRPLQRAFPAARHIFHVIDYYPAFRGQAVQALERADYALADEVLTIGRSLTDYVTTDLGIAPEKVRTLGQGVELAAYRGAIQEPEPLRGLPRPRAIWSGVLEKGDESLFRAAARTLAARGGSMVLLGPSSKWADRLVADMPETVFAFGPVPGPKLPDWLRNCDIGLMLYDRTRQAVYKGQNPLKLYEYAAAGLQIISTPHDEFEHLAPPVAIVTDTRSTETAVADACDRPTPAEDALRFAETLSWETKVEELIATYLSSPNPGKR